MPNARVWLVTGAASGIGLQVVLDVLARGDHVLAVDVSPQGDARIKKAVREDGRKLPDARWHFHVADVTTNAGVESMFADGLRPFAGQLDVLCNNAGIAESPPFSFTTQERTPERVKHVNDIVAVNLVGVIQVTLAALAHWRAPTTPRHHVPHIINTASMGAMLPMPDSPVYAATKAGVLHFSASLAHLMDDATAPIRVSTVCPSFTKTGIIPKPLRAVTEEGMTAMVGGMLQPAHVAKAFLWLVYDADPQLNNAIIRATFKGGLDLYDFVHRKRITRIARL